MKERLVEIDFIKVVMIVSMIIYHVVLNVMPIGTQPAFGTMFLRIATAGFPFIAGVLLSFSPGNYKRKFIKACKLLLLFIILNTTQWVSMTRLITLNTFGDILIYGDQLKASFEILLPLAYLYILYPIFLKKLSLWFLFSVISLVILDFMNINFYNLAGITAGICGLWIGKKNLALIKDINLVRIILLVGIMTLSVYVSTILPMTWSLNILNTVIVSILSYFIANKTTMFQKFQLKLLSDYSLFLYIFHVLLLKIIVITIPQLISSNILIVFIYCLLYIVFNYCVVLLTHTILQRSNHLNKIFTFIFK